MRMALVEIIGFLIRELVTSDSGGERDTEEQLQKQITSLYDLLLERTLDLSSYVRTKVFTVLARLCDLPMKFPKQRLAITRAAVDSLEDKASGVRKSAVMLLVKLIVTHPYGLMHGGLLSLAEWEARYKEVSDELDKINARVGKAVERDEEDEDEEEGEKGEEAEEGEEEGEGEGSSKRKKYQIHFSGRSYLTDAYL